MDHLYPRDHRVGVSRLLIYKTGVMLKPENVSREQQSSTVVLKKVGRDFRDNLNTLFPPGNKLLYIYTLQFMFILKIFYLELHG